MYLAKTRAFKMLLILIFILAAMKVNGQITILNPIDVNAGLADSTIGVAIMPTLTKGAAQQMFDGNKLTEAGVQNSDSLVVTLAFEAPKEFGRSKVFFWNNGIWRLETANTLDDLNLRTGSYQIAVQNRSNQFFQWDSTDFSPVQGSVVRLTARNLQGAGVYLGEWQLYSSLSLTALVIEPQPVRLVPGTSLQLKVLALNAQGDLQPYTLDEHVSWSTADRAIATADEFGRVTAHALGQTTIRAFTSALTGEAEVLVIGDFESTNAPTLTIKVALVLQDPVIDSTRMRRIHQVRGWDDPNELISQILEEFSISSDGVIHFEIVEKHDDANIFTKLDGQFMSIDTLAYFFRSSANMNVMKRLAEVENRIHFDYNAMVDAYDLDTKRNNGVINEVWVYAYPWGGMYESQLMGPGAFWWNSPPLAHPGLDKLLSVMGWNYERGVAEAIHSFGHRAESALWKVYGRWDLHAAEPNAWELFTAIDKELPGKAQVGNIHYPPNGAADYDYSNTRYVISYADNWKRYPILLDQTRSINCAEWGNSQLGYMRWWLNHLPRYTGVADGILNNWWHYMVDYEGAVALAEGLTTGIPQIAETEGKPLTFTLEQNYPNPFNSTATIKYSLSSPAQVSLILYDVLGRNVLTLAEGRQSAGAHALQIDAGRLASGVYFYRLKVNQFSQARKLILLR